MLLSKAFQKIYCTDIDLHVFVRGEMLMLSTFLKDTWHVIKKERL